MDLKELQHRLTIILFAIDDFCKENNIPYYLESGTALGAIRHKGFIPWDDDVDIMMDRKDFVRFCKLFSHNPPKGLALQIHKTDHNYINGYAKVRDLYTETKEDRINIEYKYNGLFVDIFPYEKVNPFLLRLSHVFFHRTMFWLVSKKGSRNGAISLLLNMNYVLSLIFDSFCRLLSKILPTTYSYTYGCNVYALKGQFMEEYFTPARYLSFEGRLLPVPNNVEKFLESLYGDYMVIPQENQRPHPHYIDCKVCN